MQSAIAQAPCTLVHSYGVGHALSQLPDEMSVLVALRLYFTLAKAVLPLANTTPKTQHAWVTTHLVQEAPTHIVVHDEPRSLHEPALRSLHVMQEIG